MKEITLHLSMDEAIAIASVLGDLPSKSGAYPLMVKIKAQIESQAKEAVESGNVD